MSICIIRRSSVKKGHGGASLRVVAKEFWFGMALILAIGVVGLSPLAAQETPTTITLSRDAAATPLSVVIPLGSTVEFRVEGLLESERIEWFREGTPIFRTIGLQVYRIGPVGTSLLGKYSAKIDDVPTDTVELMIEVPKDDHGYGSGLATMSISARGSDLTRSDQYFVWGSDSDYIIYGGAGGAFSARFASRALKKELTPNKNFVITAVTPSEVDGEIFVSSRYRRTPYDIRVARYSLSNSREISNVTLPGTSQVIPRLLVDADGSNVLLSVGREILKLNPESLEIVNRTPAPGNRFLSDRYGNWALFRGWSIREKGNCLMDMNSFDIRRISDGVFIEDARLNGVQWDHLTYDSALGRIAVVSAVSETASWWGKSSHGTLRLNQDGSLTEFRNGSVYSWPTGGVGSNLLHEWPISDARVEDIWSSGAGFRGFYTRNARLYAFEWNPRREFGGIKWSMDPNKGAHAGMEFEYGFRVGEDWLADWRVDVRVIRNGIEERVSVGEGTTDGVETRVTGVGFVPEADRVLGFRAVLLNEGDELVVSDAEADIVVGALASAIEFPEHIVAEAGDELVIEAITEVPTGLSLNWWKDGRRLDPSDGRIAVSEFGGLTVAGITENDAGLYQCYVNGSALAPVRLEVTLSQGPEIGLPSVPIHQFERGISDIRLLGNGKDAILQDDAGTLFSVDLETNTIRDRLPTAANDYAMDAEEKSVVTRDVNGRLNRRAFDGVHFGRAPIVEYFETRHEDDIVITDTRVIVRRRHDRLIWSERFDGSGSTFRAIADDDNYTVVAKFPGREHALIGAKELTRWDLETGGRIGGFSSNDESLEIAVISPDGALLFTSGADGFGQLWDVGTHELLATFNVPNARHPSCVAFSSCGAKFLLGTEEGQITLWDLDELRLLKNWQIREEGASRSGEIALNALVFNASCNGFYFSNAGGQFGAIRTDGYIREIQADAPPAGMIEFGNTVAIEIDADVASDMELRVEALYLGSVVEQVAPTSRYPVSPGAGPILLRLDFPEPFIRMDSIRATLFDEEDKVVDTLLIPFELKSRLAATIVRQPKDVFADLNGSFELDVEADGGDLGFQWLKNGVPLSDRNSLRQSVAGATTSKLRIGNVSGISSGAYSVVVNGVESRKAHVVVNSPRAFDRDGNVPEIGWGSERQFLQNTVVEVAESGRLAVMGNSDGDVVVWDVENASAINSFNVSINGRLHDFAIMEGSVVSLTFRDGGVLDVRPLEVKDNSEPVRLEGRYIRGIAYDRESSSLVALVGLGYLWLLDPDSLEIKQSFMTGYDGVALELDERNRIAYSRSFDGTITGVHLETGEIVLETTGRLDGDTFFFNNSLDVSLDGETIGFSQNRNGYVTPAFPLGGLKEMPFAGLGIALGWSSDSAFGVSGRDVYLLDRRSGVRVRKLVSGWADINSIRLGANDRYLIYGYNVGPFGVIDTWSYLRRVDPGFNKGERLSVGQSISLDVEVESRRNVLVRLSGIMEGGDEIFLAEQTADGRESGSFALGLKTVVDDRFREFDSLRIELIGTEEEGVVDNMSVPFTSEIVEPVEITLQPVDLLVDLNQSAALSIDYAGAEATVDWFHNGTRLVSDQYRQVSANGKTLMIPSVDFTDAGIWHVKVNGFASSSVELRVRVPEKTMIEGHIGWGGIRDLHYDSGNRLIHVLYSDGAIRRWKYDSGTVEEMVVFDLGEIEYGLLNSDDSVAYTLNGNGCAEAWDTSNGTLLNRYGQVEGQCH